MYIYILKGTHHHFDTEMKPKGSVGLFFKLTPAKVATTALSLYIDWAINERRWTYVDTDAIEAEITKKAKLLYGVNHDLTNSAGESVFNEIHKVCSMLLINCMNAFRNFSSN